MVAAFTSTGAPWNARLEKIDAQHVQNMVRIAEDLRNKYYMQSRDLPMDYSNESKYLNPETNKDDDYNYRKIHSMSFELCADFKTSTSGNHPYWQYVGGTQMDFRHKEGHQCFTFDFSKENTMPLKTTPLLQ